MTLRHKFSTTVSHILTWSSILWMVTLLCDRLYALHIVYLDEVTKLREEQFLRIKCQDPEFYANLARHSDLCQEVQRNANRSLLLFALKHVTETTYLCGSSPCISYLQDAFAWFTSLSLPVMAVMGMAVLFSPVALIQSTRIIANLLGVGTSPLPAHSPFYGTYMGPGGIAYGYGTGQGNAVAFADSCNYYDSSTYYPPGNNGMQILQNVLRRPNVIQYHQE
jgi:hypothetical protein